MAREYKPDWLGKVPTPAYVVEENRLVHNLEILAGLQERTGCHVLLAQKCFSMYHFYPLISTFSTYRGLPSAAPENLPVATRLANEVICLPMHHELSDKDINRVLEQVIR